MTGVCVWLGVGWEVLVVSRWKDWVCALPILKEHGESGICIVFSLRWCWGRVGGWLGTGSGRVVWCYVRVCCESGFYVLMAGPGICILC